MTRLPLLTPPPVCSTAATSTSPVGSYSSTCSGAVDPNYDINSYSAGSVAVGRAPLSITASSPAMTYGGAVPAITPSYSGFVAGDTAASSPRRLCAHRGHHHLSRGQLLLHLLGGGRPQLRHQLFSGLGGRRLGPRCALPPLARP